VSVAYPCLAEGLPQSSSASRVTAGASGVLHLEPGVRAPRAVRRVIRLRHDAFDLRLASMGEDGRAVAFDVLIGPMLGSTLARIDAIVCALSELCRTLSEDVC
jgi:hypothetical protein